jgi:hypothetical protein
MTFPSARKPPDLESLFHDFCKWFDGKLMWKRRGNINAQVLSFFERKAEEMNYMRQRDYMGIDLVWWSELSDIELALQHEAHVRDVPRLFDRTTTRYSLYPQEFRQLRDLKALRKVLIAYVSQAGEKNLIHNVQTWLAAQRSEMMTTAEQYLVVIGRSVRKESGKQPGILFHAYIFTYNGRRIKGPIDCHLTQASASAH